MKQKQKRTIAVINDDVTQRVLLSGLLDKEGFRVLAFEGAEEALTGMDPDDPPELIVTDLYMPGMDGWRFCRLLRSPEYPAFNLTPIFVVSAIFSGEEVVRITADLGANAFMSSPVDAQRFMAHIRSLLSGEMLQVAARVLLIEDSRSLAGLLTQVFMAHGYHVRTARTGEEAMKYYREDLPDIVVVDYHLPDMKGDHLLAEFNAIDPHPTMIVITSDPDPELALRVMKLGARAYARKPFDPEYLIALCESARRERSLLQVEDRLEERTRELTECDIRFRLVVENTEAGYFFIDRDGSIRDVNVAWLRMHGYSSKEEVIGCHFSLTQADRDLEKAYEIVGRLLQGVSVPQGEFTRKYKDGSIGHHLFSAHPVIKESEVIGFEGFLIDMTKLLLLEERYQMLFSQMLDGFALHEMIFDAAGEPVNYRFLAVNPAFERLTELTGNAITGKLVTEVLPDTESHWIETYGRVAITGEPQQFENYSKGLGKYFEVMAFRPQEGQFACIFKDITERKRAEEERTKLEEQLRQAQKMESIGRLAGGVAHDFNNLLTPILGYAEMLLADLSSGDPRHERLEHIRRAAERARDLTRQLLAFSRKQVLDMQRVNLKKVVSEFEKFLRHTLREDIQIRLHLPPDLGNVYADVGQIEQVLMNLIVNAQDAMPGGGILKLELADIVLDDDYAAGHQGVMPGSYVQLTVSDTGCGMDPVTLSRIFEPFFTTKTRGEGTGLGLSMVYGIVKQHGGNIWVYSEEGLGTSFKIHLPRSKETADSKAASSVSAVHAPQGTETILVVEDNEAVLEMVCQILQRQGYRAIKAENATHCIEVAKGCKEPIDLLLTDVVLPGINGRELFKRLITARSKLKVIYMSGYTDDTIAHHGILEEGINFIQKPFSMQSLAHKVREVLDR